MMSESERQRRVDGYRSEIWRRGCVIEKEWRVHNPVFDKKGEKSTIMMRIRPARTDDEADFILSKRKVSGEIISEALLSSQPSNPISGTR